MDAKVDAILHYIGDWVDDNYGERVEDCAENLTEMIKKIGEVRTMDGKAVKEIQAKMKTWTDAGIELAYNSGYEQGCIDRDEIYAEDKEDYIGLSDEIYPLTVIKDRYRGTYSGGKYLAFNLDFNEIPEDVIGSDVPCRQFFYETDLVYGKGSTIDEAIKDLGRQIEEGGSNDSKDNNI